MMTFFHWFVAIYLVLSDFRTFYSLPVFPDDNEINFLRNYGYLPKATNDESVKNLMHGDTLKNAVKLLQQFGAIEQTGVMDEATKELIKKPRCGRPDVETPETMRVPQQRRRHKRYALMSTKWEYKDLKRNYVTWAFMNENYPRSGDEFIRIHHLIHEAMGIWQHNANLTLRESRKEDADIKIDFAKGDHGDGTSFTGKGQSLAHAFQPASGLGGDVHMDQDEDWDIEDGRKGDVSFFYTFLHELGHSLGLSHSSEMQSIMFPWYVSERDWDRKCGALYEDDIHGIAQHYGQKPEFRTGPVCKDGRYPSAPTRVPNYRPQTERTTTNTQRIDTRTYRPDQERTHAPRTHPPRTRPPNPRPSTQRTPIEPEIPVFYPPQRPETNDKPDKCNTTFDAIIYFRREWMAFKDQWMWRLTKNDSGTFDITREAIPISSMWKSLKGFDHIDAVFEMKNGNIAFFIDRKIYVFDTHDLIGASDLKHFGFDHRLKKVDAIFRWGHNNNTYVFSGDYFWKVDENLHVDKKELADKYPRNIGHPFWKGVKELGGVDSAITHKEVTYFLSGLLTYKFDNGYSKLDRDNPLVSSEFWLGCRHTDKPTTKKPKRFYFAVVPMKPIDPNNMNITDIAISLSKIN